MDESTPPPTSPSRRRSAREWTDEPVASPEKIQRTGEEPSSSTEASPPPLSYSPSPLSPRMVDQLVTSLVKIQPSGEGSSSSTTRASLPPPFMASRVKMEEGSSSSMMEWSALTSAALPAPPPRQRIRPPPLFFRPLLPPFTRPPSTFISPPTGSTIILEVKVPEVEDRVLIEMRMSDSVLRLKEKVLDQETMYKVPMHRVVLQTHITKVELLDNQFLRDCPVLDCDIPDNEIDVFLKPPSPPPPPRTVAGEESGNIKVTVLPMKTNVKIGIHVNVEDTVETLRDKLDEMSRKLWFRLPTNGDYYFSHNDEPLDELMSFRWNNIQNGDTIETIDAFSVEDGFDEDDDASSTQANPDSDQKNDPGLRENFIDLVKKNVSSTSYSRPSDSDLKIGWVRVHSAGTTSTLLSTAACGGVLLNRDNRFITGYCKYLEEDECSLFKAELYGIFHGLKLALVRDFKHIEVVSACIEAITLLSEGDVEVLDDHEHQLVDLIRSLAQQAESITWLHFYGEYSKRREDCFAHQSLSIVNDARIFDSDLPQFAVDVASTSSSSTAKPRGNRV